MNKIMMEWITQGTRGFITGFNRIQKVALEVEEKEEINLIRDYNNKTKNQFVNTIISGPHTYSRF